ncbi:hypothetical protein SEVIR_9G399100v4 [Setaria viridis]|uniref:UspA domain-containing protein n=1 Tax=Setaria viridis TaxID=4556 RepID=A0A4U6T324_SETVI|nr:hypothetical protein SEVIR_9G399100v2 [Setaria viridis]
MTRQVVDSMDQYMASAADTKAKSICTAFPNLRVETCVEKGDPRDVICGAAEKAGADMLVMGSHGYGFLQRALMGSVTNHRVQNCKCPVVVVKRPGTNLRPRARSSTSRLDDDDGPCIYFVSFGAYKILYRVSCNEHLCKYIL